jgi:hypothetical protein
MKEAWAEETGAASTSPAADARGGGRREDGPGRDRFEDRGGQPEDRDARPTGFRQRIDDRLDRIEERLDHFEERLERLARGR